MTSSPFDLAHEPFLAARYVDHSFREVGLQQAMIDAHLIADLALPYPAAYGAVYRLLAALTYRITGLDTAPGGGERWHRIRNVQFGTRFDEIRIRDYFANPEHVFDLYHPQRPFLQDPRLKDECKKTSGINKLVFQAASGSARPWFDGKHGDNNQQQIPSSEAVLHLLLWAFYGAGGTQATRAHGTVSTQSGCQAAFLRGTLGYHPLGPTLHTTLLAHLTAPRRGDVSAANEDLAPWEHAGLSDPTQPAPAPAGPVSQLASRNRHGLLLVPSPDARHAVDCTLTWGARNLKEAAKPEVFVEAFPDPYLSYRRSTKTGAPSSAVEADGGRHLFRDLDVLLHSPDAAPARSGRAPTRPEVLDSCDLLPDEVAETLRLRIVGAEQDRAKTVDRQWWTSVTPLLLAHTFQRDPETAEQVEQAVRDADYSARRLDEALAAAFDDRPKDRDARDRRQARIASHFWPNADTAFWNLYDTHALPEVQGRMRGAALDAFDRLTEGMARSPSTSRRIAQARAKLPLPRRKANP